MITILSTTITYQSLALIMLVALLVGMSKTGIHGTGMIAVPILAAVFGGKMSSGMMLPMLIMADVFGVRYYHQHTEWHHLRQLLPWTALGVVLGTVAGQYIDDDLFRTIMGVTIFGSLAIMLWMERIDQDKIPSHWSFAVSLGIAAGFTTMVGNLAGAVMALYLLSMRMPKNEYIGTAAWFFLIVNVLKVPFHVFVWQTITLDSLVLNLLCLPAIALGAFIGLKIVQNISNRTYRWFIIAMNAVAAVLLLY